MSRLKVAEIVGTTGTTWKLRWDSTSCQFSIDVNVIVFVCVICTPSSQQLVPTSSAKSSGNLCLCFFDVFDILLISICMPLDLLFFSKGALKNHNLIDFCTHFLGVFIKHQGKMVINSIEVAIAG